MALYTTVGSKNIPEGAVRLSKAEALEFQKDVIKKWKSLKDIIFLQYGWVFSSAYTFTSSVYVTNITRSALNIGSHGRFLPYLMCAGVPTLVTGYWTEKRVTENSLLMSVKCPLCLNLKFGIHQALYGVAFPAVAAVMVLLPVAVRKNTIDAPYEPYDTRKILQVCFKLLKPKALQFQIVAALQIPLVFLLPYLQEKEMDKINSVLRNESVADVEFMDE